MESLSTDDNGAKLNLANFKKLYKYYNDFMFNGELNKLTRAKKFTLSNWHLISQSYIPSMGFTNLLPNTMGIYSISNGSTVIFNIDRYSAKLRNILGFTNNSQLLQYLVEAFIQDFLFMVNFDVLKEKPIDQARSELNNMYFKHQYNLPVVINSNTLLSTFTF